MVPGPIITKADLEFLRDRVVAARVVYRAHNSKSVDGDIRELTLLDELLASEYAYKNALNVYINQGKPK